MPNIRVEMLAGRTAGQKKELVEVLTRETVRIARCQPADVQIILVDVAREDWAVGGRLMSERS